MKYEEQEKIIELRKMGIGYRSIATAMDLSRDKVRYFCKAQGLDGYGVDVKKSMVEESTPREQCKNCGKRINLKPISGRPRIYCSQDCKKKWEDAHPTIHQYICYYCGIKFESPSANANFCSHKCYIRDRFWRKEDIAEVVKHLEKETPVPNAPGWIKDLIMGRNDNKNDPI